MAVAAPARKTAPAPAPSRTTPPRRKAAPARPAPQKRAAPARRPRTRPKPRGSAVARPAPARKAPVRAPRRAKPKTKRAVGGQLIPLAGRTAVAVGQLPDSGLVVRMTRGRAWIAVLGVLLAGIVTLNVITLSFAASSGEIDAGITALDQENSILRGRDARLYGTGAMRNAAGALGLAMPPSNEIHFSDAGPDDVATAAQRLAAAAGAG
ncbi:MAG TPA: hypothetical protein VFI03_01315 [Solirubrobacterales bacterium]|nr:hypothetical protein [Solirubrobacterales bacterium]